MTVSPPRQPSPPKTNPEQSDPFRDRFQSRWVILYFFTIAFSLGILLGFVSIVEGQNFVENPIIMLALNGAIGFILCIVVLVHLSNSGIRLSAVLGHWPRDGRSRLSLALIIPVLMFSLGSAQLYFPILAQLDRDVALQVMEQMLETPLASGGPGATLAAGITIVIIAPLTEEFIFRGVLLNRWGAIWGMRPALLVNAILFGFLHPNPIGLAMFGLVISIVYIKTGSLWLVIACHALNNAIAFSFSFIPSEQPETAQEMLASLSTDWVSTTLFIALSIPFLIFFLSRSWPPNKARTPYIANLQAMSSKP